MLFNLLCTPIFSVAFLYLDDSCVLLQAVHAAIMFSLFCIICFGQLQRLLGPGLICINHRMYAM